MASSGCATVTVGSRRVGAGLRIHEASELLGVPAPTLRSWEFRYGLPRTLRSPGGHRRYTQRALDELGLMRDEIATGHQPSEAVRRVRMLLDERNPARSRVEAVLAASDRRDSRALRRTLDDSVSTSGLAATVDGVLLPAMRLIGSWWESTRCDIGQEQFTTGAVRGWLAKTVTLAPPSTSARPVLLATGPGDEHTVGLEALGALLAVDGTGCRLLPAGTSREVLVANARGAAAVVVVSHLSTQRRPAVESLRAVTATGRPTFYAGSAFFSPGSRKGVPGVYLGERLAEAASIIEQSLSGGRAPVLVPPV